MSIILAVAVSYLLGSISPSFFLGKLIKGIDIRQHGDGNAGGANTFATVGVVPGILTAAFDVSKGLIALALASSLFGLSGNLLMIPVAAALAGHVFPFYLQFRGGQGAGVAVGVFFYVLVLLIASGKLPWEALALVAAIGVVVALVAPTVEFIGVAMIPLLIYEVLHYSGFAFPAVGAALLLVYLLGVTSYNFLRKGILSSDAVRGRDWPMVCLAAAGTGVLLLRVLSGRAAAMIVSLVAAAILFALGISQRRRATGGTGESVDMVEAGAIDASSDAPEGSTVVRPGGFGIAGAAFYLGAFLVTLLYARAVAAVALSFLVGGTLFGEIFGSEVGFRAVPGGNTFRQGVVFLCGCLAGGEVVSTSLGVALPPLLPAAAAAFVVVFFLPRPYASAGAALVAGLALWIIGLPLL